MAEKRFTITQDFEEHHRQIRDNGHIIMGCFIEPQAEVIVNLLNELHEEVMDLRGENTKFKLVVGEIIEDMQKYVDDDQLVYINQSYVDWIKENVDATLYSQKGDMND